MVKSGLNKWLLSVAFLALTSVGFGQGNEGSDKIKLKAALSFSPGFLTEDTRTSQIHGYLGVRPKQGRIEIRGDGFYFLSSTGDRPRFSLNHQLYAGAFYRFSDKPFQPYIGLQPGIAYSQASEFGALDQETGDINFKKTFNPVGSVGAGFDYFSEKFFFLFVETRYIFGKHKSDTYPVYLDEWRFSFGLGLHI